MCGRYLRRSDKQRLAEVFRVAKDLREMVLPSAVAPPDAPPSRLRALAFAAGALGLTAVVAFIYRDAARSYFFNDDFQWLQGARAFTLANVLHIERYNHFYRPVIEIYFHLGRRLFGCDAFPFHLASIGIHLINTLLLYLFAHALTRSRAFASLAAIFFAVQPGHAQAVAWVGAITDLLPALWYLFAMWTHLLFLQRRHARFYVISLAAFVTCLLTHESSATLLAVMIALEATVAWERVERVSFTSLAGRAMRYAPFALLLAGYLVIEYVVNSRSYLVREEHYRIGWHAVPHAIHYLITLWVGTRDVISQVLMLAVIAALLVRGTPRVRFFVLWMLVTIAPAAFFTWGNVSRYLYLPAAGFAMLTAEMILAIQRVAARQVSTRAARIAAMTLAVLLATRFAIFATKVSAGFREGTRAYERYVAAVRKANPPPAAGPLVYIDRADAEGISVLYQDPAAEVASCGPDVHVVVR